MAYPSARRTVAGKPDKLIAHFPDKFKISALALLKCGYDANALASERQRQEHERELKQMAMDSDKAKREWQREGRAFWTGCALLMICLAVSLFMRDMSPSASLILRIMAGLSVALMIACLPGIFSVDSRVNAKGVKIAIRATGAAAGFVMVYLFDPGWISSLLKRLN